MSTVRIPEVVPSPKEDCETLKKAFAGWGTDEKAVVRVLGQRNASQRKKIRETYEELYNETLVHSLRSELSGDFLKALTLWTYDPPERDARLINEGLKAWRKDVKHLQVIVEVACANTPHHLIAVRQAYCSLFDCSLEEDIASNSNVAVPVRKLLLGLVTSYRFDKEVVDTNAAKLEAEHLHNAIKKKELDHDHVVWILGTRNFFQLRATFASYKQEYSTSIDEDIVNCGKGDLQALLRIAILCIQCPERHFAEVIRTSVLGLGTDEDSLTRAIVSRAELDMTKVKFQYAQMYKSSVEDAVIGDTSGDYKNFLLTLLGKSI